MATKNLVYEEELPKLQHAIDYMNAHGGDATLRFTGAENYVTLEDGKVHRQVEVEVSGGFHIPGWEIMAKMIPGVDGNMFSAMSDKFDINTAPDRIVHMQDCMCEACNKRRMRNLFYIIRNQSDEWMVIGKDCLRVYNKGLSASDVAAAATVYRIVHESRPRTDPGYSGYSNPVHKVVEIFSQIALRENREAPIKISTLRKYYMEATHGDIKRRGIRFTEYVLRDMKKKIPRVDWQTFSTMIHQPWTSYKEWKELKIFKILYNYICEANDDVLDGHIIIETVPDKWENFPPVTDRWFGKLHQMVAVQAKVEGVVDNIMYLKSPRGLVSMYNMTVPSNVATVMIKGRVVAHHVLEDGKKCTMITGTVEPIRRRKKSVKL